LIKELYFLFPEVLFCSYLTTGQGKELAMLIKNPNMKSAVKPMPAMIFFGSVC